MEIKFLDLKKQYPLIKEEILDKFNDVINNSSFISSGYVKEFEFEFAKYCNTKYCICVNGGTSALYLALMAMGIGNDDEVILPANTFIATAEAVSLLGAKPVFVDVKEDSALIDFNEIENSITKKTKAIIPVHLYGQCADMNEIMKIAKKHKLTVLEDACQAHGAEYKNKKAGTFGSCAAFSFYPGKNLGAWGDGGAVVTNNKKLADKIYLLRHHGEIKKYHHNIIGGNFRINEFQGAVLSTKIKYLEEWNEKRRKNADLYLKYLENDKVIPINTEKTNKPVWHLFVVKLKNRKKFMDYLKEKGIQSGIHYPIPLYLTKAYSHLTYKKGDFPVSEKLSKEIVSLPMYAELTKEEIKYISEIINNY